MREVNTFRGIPYADYFNVISEWKVTDNNDKGCTIQIFLDFKFHKSTWLQGTIESNTKAELLEVFEQWYEAVNHQIRTVETKRYLQKSSNHNLMRSNSGESDGVKRKEGSPSKAKQTQDIENNLPPPKLSLQEEEDEDDGYDEEDGKTIFLLSLLPSLNSIFSLEMLPKSPHENSANTSDADDFQFYDAEDYPSDAESNISPNKLSKRLSVSEHKLKTDIVHSISKNSFYDEDHKSDDLRLPPFYPSDSKIKATPSLQQIYQQIQAREREKIYSSINGQEITTTRDLAINVVETIFVLAEFSYWQVNTLVFIVSLSNLSLRS